MSSNPHNSHPNLWRPLTGMPDGAESWGNPLYAKLLADWREIREGLSHDESARMFVQGWEDEGLRLFALESGQIEGLYTMRPGATENVVTEGYDTANAAHVYETMSTQELQDLLGDQLAALQMAKADAESGEPLHLPRVLAWHERTTRHQASTPGFRMDGGRYEKPFTSKGRWKTAENFIRRTDGTFLEFCPAEQTPGEMDRFAALYYDIRERDYPLEVEAAWLHHRFVRTHPFDDGNGRVARLFMANAYFRKGCPPPVISAEARPRYYTVLDIANRGSLRQFCEYIGDLAVGVLRGTILMGQQALEGNLTRTNGNGGRTVGNRYYPPIEGKGIYR